MCRPIRTGASTPLLNRGCVRRCSHTSTKHAVKFRGQQLAGSAVCPSAAPTLALPMPRSVCNDQYTAAALQCGLTQQQFVPRFDTRRTRQRPIKQTVITRLVKGKAYSLHQRCTWAIYSQSPQKQNRHQGARVVCVMPPTCSYYASYLSFISSCCLPAQVQLSAVMGHTVSVLHIKAQCAAQRLQWTNLAEATMLPYRPGCQQF